MPNLLIASAPLLLKGVAITLLLTVSAAVIATLFGLMIAAAQLFGGRLFRIIAETYLYIVRGVPLLVLLFAMYYALPYAGINIDPVSGGALIIGLYFAAFMADVFRGAVLVVPKGQWEAGRSIGLRTPRILADIVLPQALRAAGPPYINSMIMLVKGTALVSIIGLADVTFVGRQIVERTLAPFEIFGGVALIYFVICFFLSRCGAYLERRASFVH
ncbi:MAG: polar amino acid transport system permease protein [Variibacter sp.]|nr:polar amino acid transport system permease protein [Variibacter sp.]